MIRRLFTLTFFLSLLTCVASGALWLRSYTNDFWFQTPPAHTIYAFKVWGNVATLYRLTPSQHYPNRRAAVIEVSVSYVLSTSGVIAIVSGLYLFRPRKKSVGYCEVCGYDLRASKDRCPECGSAVPYSVA